MIADRRGQGMNKRYCSCGISVVISSVCGRSLCAQSCDVDFWSTMLEFARSNRRLRQCAVHGFQVACVRGGEA